MRLRGETKGTHRRSRRWGRLTTERDGVKIGRREDGKKAVKAVGKGEL